MKIILVSIVLLALAITVGFLFFPRQVINYLAKRSPGVLFSVDTSQNKIALTIDDSPHHEVTPKILEVLAKYNAHATFFIIGDQVDGNEELIKSILGKDHEIGNHMMHESASFKLSATQFENQFSQTHHKLKTYSNMRWFRPGSGIYNQRMLAYIKKHNYRCVLGNVHPFDSSISNINFLSWYIKKHARPGSIIILHDGKTERIRTVAVLNNVLSNLQERGLKVVTVSELADSENGR